MARREALTHLVKRCQDMVDHFGKIETEYLCCDNTLFQRQCNAFHFGYLVKTLLKLRLWPGQIEELVSGLEARSIIHISADLKRARSSLYHDTTQGNPTNEHFRCGWTTYLHKIVDSEFMDKASKASEVRFPQAQVQRLKLQPETIPLRAFQSSASSSRL